MTEYTKGCIRADECGDFLLGKSVGGIRMEEAEFVVAQIRGWGHLQYLGTEKATEIQKANAHRFAAAWNAVEGMPTEEIPDVKAVMEENRKLRAALEGILALDARETGNSATALMWDALGIAERALKGE